MTTNHVSFLEINRDALLHNLNYFKQKIASTTKTLVVTKAFGYGSDAVQIANTIQGQVDYFAVAYTHEGIALRNDGIESPILVLHPQLQNLEQLLTYQLEPNLYNFNILDAFLKLADKKQLQSYPIHIKFNTGLNRIGFLPSDLQQVLSEVSTSNSVAIASVFSHLAASDDRNEQEFTSSQIKSFKKITKEICIHLEHKPLFHMLNTSGIINYPEAQFDMVRLGIGLYGFGNDLQETNQLKNVVSLKSIISQIHQIEQGETVGYNRGFVATQPTKTATIPIGHADGISRKLGNNVGHVLINKQKAPIIGNVCMDMIMIDVTKIDCKEGELVTVFDSQKMVNNIAQQTGTISYEVLTAISQRIKRVLVN